MSQVLHLLRQMNGGDLGAGAQLLPLVYDELRKLAAARLAQENPGQTLQATALVHEAYLRLVDGDRAPCWDSQGHFFAAAAEAMRRILVERARQKRGPRRGGGWRRWTLDDQAIVGAAHDDQVLAVNEALEQLALESPVKAELVKLRFFGGLGHQEAAAVLGISRTTADRYWLYAKAFLVAALQDEGPSRFDGSHEAPP